MADQDGWVLSYARVVSCLRDIILLREGQWPDAAAFEQMGIMKKRAARHDAYFVNPCNLAAEIDARIERCGRDGLMAENYYSYRVSIRRLGFCFHLAPELVRRVIDLAIKYCADTERKRTPYKIWKFREEKAEEKARLKLQKRIKT